MTTAEEDRELIERDYPVLAAHAWYGYKQQGPGTLVVSMKGNNTAELSYVSAGNQDACGHCKALIKPYNPLVQIVVGILSDGCERVYTVSDLPPPPQAYMEARPDQLLFQKIQ